MKSKNRQRTRERKVYASSLAAKCGNKQSKSKEEIHKEKIILEIVENRKFKFVLKMKFSENILNQSFVVFLSLSSGFDVLFSGQRP